MSGERFIQLRSDALDFAIEQLLRVGAPDLMASSLILLDLAIASEWREVGRGTLRLSKSDLAERWHASRHRIDNVFDWLERADFVRGDFVRGHDGLVVVLKYEEIVRLPDRLHVPARAAGDERPGKTRLRASAPAVREERPAKTRQDANRTPLAPLGTNARAAGDMARAAGDLPRAAGDERPGKTSPRPRQQTSQTRESFPQERERDEPVDALKRRCLKHFAPRRIARDDCVRVIDQLRGENIADEIIDVALGQCENSDARSLAYLVKVTRAFYRQRTGRGPA